MEHLIATMLVWACALSGYPLSNYQPHVVLEPHSFFVETECDGKDTESNPCEYVGLYVYGTKTIYIDQGLEKKTFDAILIHELVHFLQHQSGKWTTGTCASKIAREYEAYHIEELYIKQAQRRDKKIDLPSDEEICRVDR